MPQSLFDDSLAPPTRFDLHFRVGDIPVRVHPYFWLSTLLLGLDTKREGIDIFIYMAVWAVIVFVSVLIHELGHVLMGRYFGSRGHIVLTGFCGLAVGSSDLWDRWKRNAVYLAGPGAGFLLAAVAGGLFWFFYPDITLYLLGDHFGVVGHLSRDTKIPPPLMFFVMDNVLFVNIFWGLVNLLPIWPLDGGQVCREICQVYRGREGMRLSLLISIFTAGGLAALALIELIRKKPLLPFPRFGDSWFPMIFFALLAVSGWQLLQAIKRAGPDWDEPEERQPWEQDPDWWKRGDSSWQD
jgi:stage IV sporulation protein FB